MTPYCIMTLGLSFYNFKDIQTFLSLIAKTWKQPGFLPSVGEWVDKVWYMQVMKYLSLLKRHKLSSHEKIWRELKCILLRERNHYEKATYYMTPTIWHSGNSKAMAKRWAVAKGWRERVRYDRAQRFGGSENTLYGLIMMNT